MLGHTRHGLERANDTIFVFVLERNGERRNYEAEVQHAQVTAGGTWTQRLVTRKHYGTMYRRLKTSNVDNKCRMCLHEKRGVRKGELLVAASFTVLVRIVVFIQMQITDTLFRLPKLRVYFLFIASVYSEIKVV